MGKIKRLLDRFDEMGRYPIQELGYSRTWLMFSYLHHRRLLPLPLL